MDWNTLTDRERLAKWKQFREDLSYLDTDEERLQAIATFFADVPLSKRTIDYYSPHLFPSPWDILHDGEFCESAVSLLMYHTIERTCEQDVKLWLIDDAESIFIVPAINDQEIMNYYAGEISTVQTLKPNINIVSVYQPDDLKPIN